MHVGTCADIEEDDEEERLEVEEGRLGCGSVGGFVDFLEASSVKTHHDCGLIAGSSWCRYRRAAVRDSVLPVWAIRGFVSGAPGCSFLGDDVAVGGAVMFVEHRCREE